MPSSARATPATWRPSANGTTRRTWPNARTRASRDRMLRRAATATMPRPPSPPAKDSSAAAVASHANGTRARATIRSVPSSLSPSAIICAASGAA